MKTEDYKCHCCEAETKKARAVDVENLKHLILCNFCNMQLIIRKFLRLDGETVLKVTGKRGDFLKITAYDEVDSETFWENRRRVKELAEMDNQSMVGWDVHESY